MNHGDDLEQVVLTQLLQTVGKLLHVNVLVSPILLLLGVLVARTVDIRATRLLQQREKLRLGVPEGLAFESAQCHLIRVLLCAHSPLGAWPRNAQPGSSGRAGA